MTETIPSMFIRQAATLKEKTLFLVKREGTYRPVTWGEAQELVLALSAFFLHRQIDSGDRIAILSENRFEWATADLAIQSAGAWTVPIYPTLAAQDIRAIAQNCQPVICIASNTDQAKKWLEVASEVASVRLILVIEGTPAPHPLLLAWTAAIHEGREVGLKLQNLLEHRREQIRPEATATLIYTSGTTGEPKGVMLSHSNFLSNAEACRSVIPVSSTDVHLSFLPLSHVFERMAGWYFMLMAGATVAYAESMDTIPQNMLEVHPTVMLGVPRFFEKLYAKIQEGIRQAPPLKRRLAEWALEVGQATLARQRTGQALTLRMKLEHGVADRLVCSKLKAKLGGRLRFFVSGGAPLNKTIGEFFYSMGITILEGYGLTETSPVIAANRFEHLRFGSVGQTVPGVEVWIAEDGEILTRGAHVMQGYYKNPEATAAAIVDGWFHTGDIGHLDSEGYLFITDRKKDLIKTAGGKFVAPQKLEGLLVTDPYISQVFVYGDRQPYCVALIVPNFEQLRRYAQEQEIVGRSPKELVSQAKVLDFYWARVQAKQEGFASFEQVKKIALLDQEFSQAAGELTPTLKTKRAIIAQRYEALLRSLYQTSAA